MRRRLPLVAWAALWAVVVVLSATSVWWAISRAGAHVTGLTSPPLSSSIVTVTPAPQATPTPLATPTPSPKPTSPATPRTTPRPTSSATRTHNPPPTAVQGSWSGKAGRVTATCRSRQIRLDAAVPSDGFTVEIGNRGPETLEIEFHKTGGESEFKVEGVCRGTGPVFSVEEE